MVFSQLFGGFLQFLNGILFAIAVTLAYITGDFSAFGDNF